jgi:hypothetical protein
MIIQYQDPRSVACVEKTWARYYSPVFLTKHVCPNSDLSMY